MGVHRFRSKRVKSGLNISRFGTAFAVVYVLSADASVTGNKHRTFAIKAQLKILQPSHDSLPIDSGHNCNHNITSPRLCKSS